MAICAHLLHEKIILHLRDEANRQGPIKSIYAFTAKTQITIYIFHPLPQMDKCGMGNVTHAVAASAHIRQLCKWFE